jgi:hypothetical protein
MWPTLNRTANNGERETGIRSYRTGKVAYNTGNSRIRAREQHDNGRGLTCLAWNELPQEYSLCHQIEVVGRTESKERGYP